MDLKRVESKFVKISSPFAKNGLRLSNIPNVLSVSY